MYFFNLFSVELFDTTEVFATNVCSLSKTFIKILCAVSFCFSLLSLEQPTKEKQRIAHTTIDNVFFTVEFHLLTYL